MGRVGDELAAHALLLLDLAGHAIERVRERPDLFGPARAHSDGVIALRDELRGLTDLAKRRGHAPSDKDRESDTRDRRDPERGDEETRHALLEHRLRRGERLAVIDHELRERHARERERADRQNETDDDGDRDHGHGDLSREASHASRSARYPAPRTVAT